MPLDPQTQLGNYKITSLIGAGGTGEVYKAIDTRLQRPVAIKLLTGLNIDRLEREARAIAALNNPYVCAIYDVGDNYLVMEYIDGAPLEGPLPLHQTVQFATQIATALEEAHFHGIIHRDLKPANILVAGDSVKLLDFGHAKQLSPSEATTGSVTLAGSLLGTAAYMSPEQAQGRAVDLRTDIFSFGVVLYEMLSGRRPFAGETVLDVLNAIVNDEPLTLETIPELQRIVTRCLCKDAEDRFQSMSDLKVALAQVPVNKPKRQPSIAVLPFANLSANPENEYFSEGLTDEIINALAQIPGLRVTARTSAFMFRKKEEDIRRIAETLDVETILEGSVRVSRTKLRITAQLINASDGYHLWAKSYDREMDEVFAIQDDIAQAIAKALQVRLYHGSTVNIAAYEAYLKARYYLARLTPEALTQSRECYEEAIALDGEFAMARSGYAEYFLMRAILGMIPADEAMPAARANARKALDIDPSLPDAHAVLATVAALYDYDRREAEHRFELALAHEAASPVVHILHALYYLLPKGEAKEAAKEIERCLRDDPLNAALHYVMGICFLDMDRREEACREFHETLEIDNHSIWAMAMLAMDYWARGLNAEAVAWAERVYSLRPSEAMPIGLYAGMLAWNDEAARSKKIVVKLSDGRVYGTPVGLTVFHMLVGELDKAAYWFERILQQRDTAAALQLLHSPLGKAMSSCPWWPALVKTMNLQETIVPVPADLVGSNK